MSENQAAGYSSVSIGFQVSKLEELRELSKILANSKMVPKDYLNNPDAVLTGILFGQELGLSPLQALQNVANINGRPAIWGDAAKALCENSGQMEDFREWYELEEQEIDESAAFEAFVAQKNVVAKCYVKRKGKAAGVTKTFSARMAQHAGLLDRKTVWDTFPISMLGARPRGFALRSEFADVLKGLYLREEIIGGSIDLERSRDGAYAMPGAEPATSANDGISASSLTAKLKMPKANQTLKIPPPTQETTPTPASAEPVPTPSTASEPPTTQVEESTSAPASDAPTANDYQRGQILMVKPKDGPSGPFALVEVDWVGKPTEMVYAPSAEAKLTLLDLQGLIGHNLFFLVKADKKQGKLVRQMYDVFPEDVFEAAMLEREAQAANVEPGGQPS